MITEHLKWYFIVFARLQALNEEEARFDENWLVLSSHQLVVAVVDLGN